MAEIISLDTVLVELKDRALSILSQTLVPTADELCFLVIISSLDEKVLETMQSHYVGMFLVGKGEISPRTFELNASFDADKSRSIDVIARYCATWCTLSLLYLDSVGRFLTAKEVKRLHLLENDLSRL